MIIAFPFALIAVMFIAITAFISNEMAQAILLAIFEEIKRVSNE